MPVGAAPPRRAPLPARARHTLLAHPRRRRQGRPPSPKLAKVVEADEIARKAGYSRPHTVHCGPDGIYVSALGNPGGDGPGGVFLLDHETFEVKGAWEEDRGPQQLAYDFWWHLLTTRWSPASGERRR